MDKYQQIGQLIREAREGQNMSQEDLAKAIGFESGTAISLIEAGKRKVSITDLESISNILHITIEQLLGNKELVADVRFALRADKNLSPSDRSKILEYIDFIKSKKDGR